MNRGQIISEVLNFMPYKKINFVNLTGNGLDIMLIYRYQPFTVFNDIDKNIFWLFKTIRDPDDLSMFREIMRQHDDVTNKFTVKNHVRLSDFPEMLVKDYVFAAYLFYLCYHNSISFYIDVIRDNLREVPVQVPESVREHLHSIPYIYEIYLRFSVIQIDCLDIEKCISTYDSTDTFFYGEFSKLSNIDIDKLFDVLNNIKGLYTIVLSDDQVTSKMKDNVVKHVWRLSIVSNYDYSAQLIKLPSS